jgi:hypothetical protein
MTLYNMLAELSGIQFVSWAERVPRRRREFQKMRVTRRQFQVPVHRAVRKLPNSH